VWQDAKLEEYNSIMINDVWEIVSKPVDKSVVGSRWIYKIKYVVDGNVEKYKARFVAKSYAQKDGLNYLDIFTLVARYTSIRFMISLATQMGWQIHQMDIKTAFLNGVIEEEVYIEQLEGFKAHERDIHVCKLKRAPYGIKQARKAWYGQIDSHLQQICIVKSKADSNLYYLMIGGEPLILILYLDNLFLTRSSSFIEDYKKDLVAEFEMMDLKLMHYFLGQEVW